MRRGRSQLAESVIPAKAGIHFNVAEVNMGPRVRGDDDRRRATPWGAAVGEPAKSVIPAKAGIHFNVAEVNMVPAFAGTTI